MTRLVRTTIGILGCILLAGCFSPGNITVVDEPLHAGRPTIKKVRARGDNLQVSLVQDASPVFVAEIRAQIIEGDIYLIPQTISSVAHGTEFTVDFSHDRFPRDWKNRLYWIEGDTISSPVNPFIKHVREIRRSKVQIEK